jgi:hypothetical protein
MTFGGVPQTDTVIYSVIETPTPRSRRHPGLLNGELDYLGINVMGAELQTLKDSGKAAINTLPLASPLITPRLNCTGELRANTGRHAGLAMGVDREALLTKALGGQWRGSGGFAPKAIAWAYNQDCRSAAADTAPPSHYWRVRATPRTPTASTSP